jgi:hypothetical protein
MLLSEGVSLSKQYDDIQNRANTNDNTRKLNGVEREKAQIEQSILVNKQEQAMQTTEVEKQKVALALLTTEASKVH